MFLDDDSDSGDAFEIGIAKANKKSVHQYLQDDDSMDSFAKQSNRVLEV
jgi:nucleoside 2-deoxyribosyltransferase